MNESNNKTQAETQGFEPKPGGADPVATRLVAELPHDRGILACQYEQSGKYLFSGARDYFVHRWDLSQEPTLEPPSDPKKKPKTPPVPQPPPRLSNSIVGPC